jgi:ABC-type multidrug transport system permease subunit
MCVHVKRSFGKHSKEAFLQRNAFLKAISTLIIIFIIIIIIVIIIIIIINIIIVIIFGSFAYGPVPTTKPQPCWFSV